MKRKKLPSFKKDIKDFLLSEEGKISKKNIVKIGMYLAMLKILFEPDTAGAAHTNTHASHNNYFYPIGGEGAGRGGHYNNPGTGHVSWHNDGGWC